MARRSDHTREELWALILGESHRQMACDGFRAFSARSVAKAIGYSVGTIYNVFGSLDALLTAVNTQTFRLWTEHVRRRLLEGGADRIDVLVDAYFEFAEANSHLWMAIYDHRLPLGAARPQEDVAERAKLTDLVTHTVAAELGREASADDVELTRSLIAVVHGHCSLKLNRSYSIMGGQDPVRGAKARVREALDAARRADAKTRALGSRPDEASS